MTRLKVIEVDRACPPLDGTTMKVSTFHSAYGYLIERRGDTVAIAHKKAGSKTLLVPWARVTWSEPEE